MCITSFGEGGEIGIIFNINWEVKFCFEHLGDIEVVPREIAEPDSAVALDDAGHSDGDGLNVCEDEIDFDLLQKSFVEFGLIFVS